MSQARITSTQPQPIRKPQKATCGTATPTPDPADQNQPKLGIKQSELTAPNQPKTDKAAARDEKQPRKAASHRLGETHAKSNPPLQKNRPNLLAEAAKKAQNPSQNQRG